MVKRISIGWLTRVICRPGFWLLVAVFVLITIPHYREELIHPAFLTNLLADLSLERHAFERIIYLAPIIWAGFLFGWRGATVASLAALGCMLPRAIYISPYPRDAFFEASAVFIVGNLMAISFEGLRKERLRRTQLAALNQTSAILSRTLDLKQVLDGAVENTRRVMQVNATMVFLLDEATGDLTLCAYQGLSSGFAQGVDRLKLGEGLNGMVAQNGNPLFIEDTAKDPRLTRAAVTKEGIRSQLIVPLKSKGKVMGTLCVATLSHRRFRQDEVELLSAIGSQIGVAVENAHLYEKERETAQQLARSERNYRRLFENANDAIWVQDLQGNIMAVNEAAARLTGYSIDGLIKMNVRHFLSEESLRLAAEIRRKLLQEEAVEQPYDQQLIKKDGTEAILKLTSNVIVEDGEPIAFQHIARDVTAERRMQDNLRYYLNQITRAQEEERKRIARELHDDTIQALVVLSRQLDELTSGDKGLPEDKRLRLDNLRQQTNSTIDGVRRLSQDLRPVALDRLGLLPALEWLASDLGKHSGIPVEIKVHGTERRLTAEAELLLFRIAQEALRNVWRHSEATSAEVIVEFEESRIRVSVKDNGKGFGLRETMGDLIKEGRLGLAGMQERARLLGGSLRVEPEPGKGTTVTVEAPI